jgi:hypothetical protein
MPDKAYPNYINGPVNLPIMRGPYRAEGVRMANLLLEADYDQVLATCHTYLNVVSGRQKSWYIPLILPNLKAPLLFTYADIEAGFSLNEADRRLGVLPELDAAFFIPTLVVREGGPGLAFFTPYIFVSNLFGVLIGREVYGLPKSLGDFVPPRYFRQPEVSMRTPAFKTLSPNSPSDLLPLLEVRLTEAAEAAAEEQLWSSGREVAQGILQLLADSETGEISRAPLQHHVARSELADEIFLEDLKAALAQLPDRIKLLDLFDGPNVPLVALKQFRDAVDFEKAVYQAVLETQASISLLPMPAGGLLAGRYQLSAGKIGSLPIGEALGLGEEPQEALGGFWVEVNFDLGAGRVIAG